MWRRSATALAALLGGLALSLGSAGAASAAPAAHRLRVTIALTPRDPSALATYARAVSTPGSADYHDYLTPREFAARFGASPARTAALRAALRARGLGPGTMSAGGLSLSFTASAAQLRRAHVAATGTDLPRAARSVVQSVIGLTAADGARPLAVRAAHRPRTRLSPRLSRARGAAPMVSGPQPCPVASADAPREGAYTDNLIAASYGFDGLYAAGDEGQGTTVAVYELEPDDPADIAAFQRCYGTHTQVSYVHVDGGAGVGAGSDEAAFDIENLIGFAPGVRLLVYQGPNSNSGLPGSGPYDTYSAIVNQDRARVISDSWGQCERQLGRAAALAEDELFQQAAAQGQTVVAAAGDDGSEDCDTGGARSSDALAVDDPASQPWVTGVGGTTLAALGPPPVQHAWNSETTPGSVAIGAGGGGVSSLWPMPGFQSGAPGWLHVRRGAARGSLCGRRSGDCREVPDVSADADPTTGYEIYWNGSDSEPEPAGWQALGGTSGAAPVWAALFALADSSPACDSAPVGYAGPALYRAAAEHYAADFHDVAAGDNDFSGTHGSQWPAGPGYDLATGLGTPNATPLVQSLCADTMRLAAPAAQSSAYHASVRVALHTSGLTGPGTVFSASHLPPGVRLEAHDGLLVGRPERPGRWTVRIGARDARGSRAAATFSWGIGGNPHIALAHLSGGRLSLVVRCGPHAPTLRKLWVRLPAALRSSARPRVVAGASRANVSVTGQIVTIAPGTPTALVSMSIPVAGGAAGLRDGAEVVVSARTGTTGTNVLHSAVDTGAGS